MARATIYFIYLRTDTDNLLQFDDDIDHELKIKD